MATRDYPEDIRVSKIYVDEVHNKAGTTLLNIQAGARSAYTQTFATASKTHTNQNAGTLTAASGTANTVVDDVGGAFNQTTLNNNFKECATEINNLVLDVDNIKKVLNAIIDDLQALGLVG